MASKSHRVFPAAFKGELAKVKKILREEPDAIAARNAKNLTPLHVAASRGHARVVECLLMLGADISGPSGRDEWTPLLFAAYRGHLDAVRVLLKHDADPTDRAGNPIHFAGQRGHKAICRELVAHGAVDNLLRSKDEDLRRLFRAAYSYESAVVEEIVTRRPRLVDRKDKNGRTPLHEACTNGDTATVRVLLAYGADPTVRDKHGDTPLDRAESHCKRAVIRLLTAC